MGLIKAIFYVRMCSDFASLIATACVKMIAAEKVHVFQGLAIANLGILGGIALRFTARMTVVRMGCVIRESVDVMMAGLIKTVQQYP